MLGNFSTNSHISTFVLVYEQLEYKIKDLITLNQNALNYMYVEVYNLESYLRLNNLFLKIDHHIMDRSTFGMACGILK